MSIDLDTGRVVDRDRGITNDGEGIGSVSNARLPWQWDDDVQATSSIKTLPVSSATSDSTVDAPHAITSLSNIHEETGEDYDCILDSGIMNAVISSIPTKVTWHSKAAPDALVDLVKLMSEANQSIREFGIYVAITQSSIPEHTRGYLDSMGEVMGMQWKYDLDGVSSEEYHVNVARKYFTGAVNLDPTIYSTGKILRGGNDDGGKNMLMP